MGTRTAEATNAKIAEVATGLKELIRWAYEDAADAATNEAPDTAADDRNRAKHLSKALALVENCER